LYTYYRHITLTTSAAPRTPDNKTDKLILYNIFCPFSSGREKVKKFYSGIQ